MRNICSHCSGRAETDWLRSPGKRKSHALLCSTGAVVINGSKGNCRLNLSAFFESPSGVEFLHRLLVAVHLVFGQSQDAGLRSLSWFLELTQLDHLEGRNGQLSLRHHGLHRLTARKLKALRVLHNYVVRRADDTTAAERFFGQRARDVFAWLLQRMNLPGRPRNRPPVTQCQHQPPPIL